MLKIINICCIIVAVCFNFQNAEARRFLSFNPLDSFNNAQEQVSKPLQEIMAQGEKFQKFIPDAIKPNLEILNGVGNFGTLLKAVQNIDISACTNLYKEGSEIFGQLSSMLGTCINDGIGSVDTKRLKDIINNLQEIAAQEIPKTMSCIRLVYPWEVFQCVNGIGQEINEKLTPMKEDVMKAANELGKLGPNISNCVKMAFSDFIQKNSNKFSDSVRQCYQSIF